MYFRILARDLKRKKTMNIILLIFIILAATFISSSTNNLVVITTAMESYFKKAGLGDYLILSIKEEKNDQAITDFLNKNDNVESWSQDESVYLTENNIRLADNKSLNVSNTALVSSYHIAQQKFFDSSNREITKMNDGEIYLPNKLLEENKLKIGDKLTLINGDISIEFTIKGICKDAFFGSTVMGASRLIISDRDYEKLKSGAADKAVSIYSVKSSDVKTLEQNFNRMGFQVVVACNKELVSLTYVMDMMIAGVLLAVSICLILISLVILRFTIVFTLNQEFREIGIMKAIGIKSRRIRRLYITKYLAVSVLGAFLGFLLSIPFGNMFLKQVARNVIISNGTKGLFINLACCALIVAIVILFCYFCTHRVNRYTPIDAIRNGSNGERFYRKGVLCLGRHQLSAVWFLAVNDILSGIRRFGILIITFTIGIILIIVPINTINTLKSEKLLAWFGMTVSDLYLVDDEDYIDFKSNGQDYMEEFLKGIEAELKQNGIPATASCEGTFKFRISYQGNTCSSQCQQGTGISADQYTYTEGQPPRYSNEVALTRQIADKIEAGIGDTVTIKTGDSEEEFIVTAFFQSMNNLGEGIRFSGKAVLDYSSLIGTSGIQISYSDHPAKSEVRGRMERIKELFPQYKVYNSAEYLVKMMGNIAEQLESIKGVIIIVILLINLMVAVLMEKTFLTKERGEIGMLKSIGFGNGAIVRWQAARIGIILIISTVLGTLLSNPIAQLTTAKGFLMMGASHIDFVIKPLEVYLMYPLLIFAVTMAASILTAVQAKGITPHEVNNIE